MENFTDNLLSFFDKIDSLKFEADYFNYNIENYDGSDPFGYKDEHEGLILSLLISRNQSTFDEIKTFGLELNKLVLTEKHDVLSNINTELNKVHSNIEKAGTSKNGFTKLNTKIKLDYLKPLIAIIEKDLPQQVKSADQPKRKVADKWYALLHLILILIGKENQIINYSKKGIIDFGKNKYNTGQGFYVQIRNIDLLDMKKFVRSLPNKDKLAWKKIITEISGNDADVISWLSKLPN